MLLRNALRSDMSSNRFYAVNNSSRAVCSFAAAKVRKKFDICKFILHLHLKLKFRAQNKEKNHTEDDYATILCEFVNL